MSGLFEAQGSLALLALGGGVSAAFAFAFAVSGALFMSRRRGRLMFTARGVSLAAASLGVLSAFAAYGMSLVLA